jgi:hypothetical protein
MSIKLLEGVTLRSITGLHQGSEEIVFTAVDGRRFRMYHSQDCCERVEVEDVYGDAEDIIGEPITLAEERSMEGPGSYDSSTWTFYQIRSRRGTIDIRWLGVSNGYYSERVSFEEIDAADQAVRGLLADGVYEVDTVDGREWWLWDGDDWRDFSGDILTPAQARRRFTVLGPALRRS